MMLGIFCWCWWQRWWWWRISGKSSLCCTSATLIFPSGQCHCSQKNLEFDFAAPPAAQLVLSMFGALSTPFGVLDCQLGLPVSAPLQTDSSCCANLEKQKMFSYQEKNPEHQCHVHATSHLHKPNSNQRKGSCNFQDDCSREPTPLMWFSKSFAETTVQKARRIDCQTSFCRRKQT